MERTLLLVNDEENITSALVRLLRRDGNPDIVRIVLSGYAELNSVTDCLSKSGNDGVINYLG